MRNLPFRVTWPESGFKSPVRSLILMTSYKVQIPKWTEILQGWLSWTVGAYHRYPWVESHVEIDALEEKLFQWVTESDIISLEQRWRYFVCFWKPWTCQLMGEVTESRIPKGLRFLLLWRLKVRKLELLNCCHHWIKLLIPFPKSWSLIVPGQLEKNWAIFYLDADEVITAVGVVPPSVNERLQVLPILHLIIIFFL